MTKTKHDWTRADAMTEADIHAAALADPDAQPLTPERLAKMTRTPQVRVIRRALGLSQEEFATRFHIPRKRVIPSRNVFGAAFVRRTRLYLSRRGLIGGDILRAH